MACMTIIFFFFSLFQTEHSRWLMDTCLPRLLQMDRQALYYCTQRLQAGSASSDASLRVLVGVLRHARACGMIEHTGLAMDREAQANEHFFVTYETLQVGWLVLSVFLFVSATDFLSSFLLRQAALKHPDTQVRASMLAFLCEVRRKRSLAPSVGDLQALKVSPESVCDFLFTLKSPSFLQIPRY